MDPRHQKRIEIIQNLFALSFEKTSNNLPFPKDEKTTLILKHIKEIDEKIYEFKSEFPLERISKTDLAILRLSVYDLLIEKKMPAKVIINEAVELAKDLSSEKSFGFVNAILGRILEKNTL